MKTLFTFLLLFLSLQISAQDFALNQLNNSPRHHEWVQLEVNGKTLHSFVAYPEKSTNTQALIVIHENRGLTDWVRSFADQLAEAGYLAIAPDLLSDYNDSIEKTSDFENSDKAREAIYQLDPQEVTQRLDAVYEYVRQLPASNGKISVIGFCWGGSQAFRYATHNPDLQAAFVFYGTAPEDPAVYQNIDSPVYGFYGGNDQRVNSTIEKTSDYMKQAGKPFKYKIYPDARQAYMRSGDDPEGSIENKTARKESWKRLKSILKKQE